MAPRGLPEWKQPSFDDDDRIDPEKHIKFNPGVSDELGQVNSIVHPLFSQGFWGAIWVFRNEMKVAKAFYFCFFGAFGSLFPLLAVYFKGLGMDAAQTGFIIGIRPIIEYLATPFWHRMSDRSKRHHGLIQYS